MTRTLLCFSGGLDSVTLAATLKQKRHELFGLFIDRGQSNVEREREAVEHFQATLVIPVAETSLRDWSSSWQRLDGVSDRELPRNGMFVFAALPFARERHVDYIALGCNRDDTSVPDGSPKFVTAVNQLLEATEQPERLVAPFLDDNMGKADIAARALELLGEKEVERTWSCWKGEVRPCGGCLACRSRNIALETARSRLRSHASE